MPFDDFLANSQADTGAGEFVASVKALEHAENTVEILRFDSQPIVLYRKQPFVVWLADRRNMHRGHAGFLILDRVGHQVLEQLDQLDLIGAYVGQGSWVTNAPLSAMTPPRFLTASCKARSLEVSSSSLPFVPTRE